MGEAQSSAGSTNCEQCTPGTYAELEGQSLCSMCPAGMSSREIGALPAHIHAQMGYSLGAPPGTQMIADPETCFQEFILKIY